MRVSVKQYILVLISFFVVQQSAYAVCLENKVCIEGFIAGGLQIAASDDGKTATSSMSTLYNTEIATNITLAEKNGWTTAFSLNLEAGLDDFDTAELSVTNGTLTVIAGHTGIGGIDQGNAYTTELGSSNTGTYGDGTVLGANLIAIGYSAGADIKFGIASSPYEAVPSVEEEMDDTGAVVTEASDAQDADMLSYALVISGAASGLGYGFEYEGSSYGEPADAPSGFTAPDSQSTITLGLQYDISGIVPFLNYGAFTQNADVTESAVNIGVDLKLGEALGITVGIESIDSGIDGDDAESHVYTGVSYALMGDTSLGFGYWSASKGDTSMSDITVEFIANF